MKNLFFTGGSHIEEGKGWGELGQFADLREGAWQVRRGCFFLRG